MNFLLGLKAKLIGFGVAALGVLLLLLGVYYRGKSAAQKESLQSDLEGATVRRNVEETLKEDEYDEWLQRKKK